MYIVWARSYDVLAEVDLRYTVFFLLIMIKGIFET